MFVLKYGEAVLFNTYAVTCFQGLSDVHKDLGDI